MLIEKHLRDHSFFIQAFLYAPVAAALLAPNGQWLHTNSAFSEFIGYLPVELQNLTFQDVTHPDDIEKNQAMENDLLQGKRDSYRLEKRFIHKSGHVIWGVLSRALVRDDQGQPLFFINQILDITEQNKIENDLKESLLQNTRITNNSIDVIARLTLRGEYLYLSPSCKVVMGYEPENLIGKPFYQYLHPDHLEGVVSQYCSLISEGNTHDDLTFSFQFLKQDGSYVWIESTGKIITDESGNTKEILCFLRDITQRKRAEEKVRQSQHSLMQAQRIAHIGSWEEDLINHQIYCSDELYRIFGIEPTEVSPSRNLFFDLVHPDDFEFVFGAVMDARSGKPYNIEYRIVRPDGLTRVVHSFAEVSFDEIGRPVLFLSTIQDVTERRNEQNKLKEHEQLFELISEHSQDIICYVNPGGVYQYVSPVVRKLLGYEPEEVMGKRCIDFFHPEDFVQMANGILKHSNEATFTARVRHKQGHYVWFETTLKAIRNDSGDIEKMLGVGRDITARKLAEDEVRKTKERLESLIQNNADAIWVIDLDDTVLEVNHAFEKMFGWNQVEVIGQKLPIIPDHLKNQIQQLHERVKSGESILGFETVRMHRDGGVIHASVTLSPIRDSAGAVIGISGTCRDISELMKRKENERKLQYANEKLLSISSTDALTGIPNRRRFEEILQNEWERAILNSSELTLMMIDIDYFKEFNDTYSHLNGDECLKKVAETLHITLKRPRDFIARYGGEEFVIILPETDGKGAAVVAESLRESIEGLHIPHVGSNISSYVTISLGVATTIPHAECDYTEIICAADRALYVAKEEGRNKYCTIDLTKP